MKKTLLLLIITVVCVAGFLSVRGTMPFMPVFGVSMEPELQAGNLILIKAVSPSEVKVGDIIVFTIPAAVREYYNYPPVVAHRVIKVQTPEQGQGLTFRTKGDNTGEDPFTVRPQDLRGKVSNQIPFLGFPLLFFQSQQGFIFVVVALFLLAFYLYADELNRGRQKFQRGIFAPVIEESQRSRQVLEHRIASTENRMLGTQQALNSFASAIAEYAEHLKSHTSAIQGLSEASQELKKGAVEQNKILTRLVETMGEMGPKPEIKEIVPRKAEIKPEIKEIVPRKAEIKSKVEVGFPPGCFRSRRKFTEEDKLFRAG